MHSSIDAARTRNDGKRKTRTSLTSGFTQQGSGVDVLGAARAEDLVVQLRQVGSDRRFALPVPRRHGDPAEEGLLLGASEQCDLRIADPKKRVSRQHARVFYREGHWRILDLGSRNGLYVDGIKQQAVQLVPGMLIRVGSVTLVAESRRFLELRAVLARLLGWGWGDEREAAVEKALQDVRNARAQHEPLWLHSEGEGDLSAIAQELHRAIFSAGAPFVMCDARRQPGAADARSPANEDELTKAIAAAKGGTLCVRQSRLPGGLAPFVQRLRAQPLEAAPDVQVMILCEETALDVAHVAQGTITIPPLCTRSREQIANVVREYLLEAKAELGSSEPLFPSDLEWLMKHSARTFAEVKKGTLRITALRMADTMVEAASLLGMAPVSLRRWLGRRQLPQIACQRDDAPLPNDHDDREPGA